MAPVSNVRASGYFDKSYDFYMKQGVMLINSFLGSTAVINCPGSMALYSMWAWAAGTITHLGVEIFHKGEHEDRLTELTEKMDSLKAKANNLATEGDSIQLEALKTLKLEHEAMRDFMNKRKGWTIAIHIMYDVAVALAILEWAEAIASFGAKNNVIACKPMSGLGGLLLTFLMPAVQGMQQDGGTPSTIASIAGSGAGMVASYGAKHLSQGLITKLTGIQAGINKVITTPIGRTILFGANSVLTGFVINGLAEREEIASTNISTIDKAITDFRIVDPGSDIELGTPGTTQNAAEPPKGQIKKLGEVQTIKKCLSTNSTEGISYSTSSCKNPVKLSNPSMSISGNFPTLSQAMGLGTEMANAVAAGDMQKAELMSSQLGSMAAKIRDIKSKLQEKLNADLKKAGKQPVDFDKEFKQQLAGMTPSSSATSPNADLASNPGPLKTTTDPKSKDKDTEGMPTPQIVMPETKVPEMMTEGLEENQVGESTPTLEESLNDFEVPVEDISKESKASIFQQVSNRYILNYTRLFEQKKSLEEEAVSDSKTVGEAAKKKD